MVFFLDSKVYLKAIICTKYLLKELLNDRIEIKVVILWKK